MYKKPTSVSKELLLVNPFTLEVWLGVAVMVTIIGPISYLVHRSSYYYTFTGENNEKPIVWPACIDEPICPNTRSDPKRNYYTLHCSHF